VDGDWARCLGFLLGQWRIVDDNDGAHTPRYDSLFIHMMLSASLSSFSTTFGHANTTTTNISTTINHTTNTCFQPYVISPSFRVVSGVYPRFPHF